jgi:hypothetical protein
MDISEQIDEFRMDSRHAAALRAVIGRYAPVVDVVDEHGYISVRPPDRHIAAYFNRGFVDVVVDPLKADAVAVANPGTRVQPKRTSTTAYLRVSGTAVSSDRLEELVLAALARQEAGRRWGGRATNSGLGADLAGQTCQTC